MSKLLIKCVNLRIHHRVNLLELIQLYLVKEWDIFIYHIFREGNSCADILVKLSANIVMMHQPLSCLPSTLLGDVIWVSFIKT